MIAATTGVVTRIRELIIEARGVKELAHLLHDHRKTLHIVSHFLNNLFLCPISNFVGLRAINYVAYELLMVAFNLFFKSVSPVKVFSKTLHLEWSTIDERKE